MNSLNGKAAGKCSQGATRGLPGWHCGHQGATARPPSPQSAAPAVRGPLAPVFRADCWPQPWLGEPTVPEGKGSPRSTMSMLPCRREEGKGCVFSWAIRREVLKRGLRKESLKTEAASPGGDRGPEAQRTQTWQKTPSLEQALRPRPGMLPLRWPERPGNPSCARSCLYLPGPRGGNHSKVPKDRLASIRKLGKRGYTTNHPASHTHIDGSIHTCLQRHTPILHTHEDKHIHIHVTGNTKHRHAGTHKFRPHEGASAHRGEWTRACRYAQRDTLLCVHTRTHTRTHTPTHVCVCRGP